jgi:hypothetical protein
LATRPKFELTRDENLNVRDLVLTFSGFYFMHNYLMDRHKPWLIKGWHAMCSPCLVEYQTMRGTQMKVYQVECRAIVTLAASDMEEAALRGAVVIKDNPHLILVRGVHEITLPATLKDSSENSSQKDSIGERHPFPLAA